MTFRQTDVFHLPEQLAAKNDPSLIADDIAFFAIISQALTDMRSATTERLHRLSRTQVRSGQPALERDLEIHHHRARLRTLERYGLDLCLGRITFADGTAPSYIGRIGLKSPDGTQLLIDWRSPAAAPYFAATHENPLGVSGRRRYRWQREHIVDYWDEVFTLDGSTSTAALDDQSAFIASLNASRTPQMRDVLSTIAADQDAIIRASARGALIVDGGPGTGKTVVALHRAAYLLYSDPRLGHHRGNVLFVGPHRPYLAYVADVLPNLGEEGVQLCLTADLVPEGAQAEPERDAAVARLKERLDPVAAIERAVQFYEEPPTEPYDIETERHTWRITAADWKQAFESVASGTPHNEAREQILDDIATLIIDRLDEQERDGLDVSAAVCSNRGLLARLHRAWPILSATDIVADLWSVPAFLRLCAPQLDRSDIGILQRDEPYEWTDADLPWLDAAYRRLGTAPTLAAERRKRQTQAAEDEVRARVTEELIAADDDFEGVVTMLRGDDLREALVDESGFAEPTIDRLAGPFAHVVVDEAQELTDAQWRMLIARCPSKSFTIVGDRAQARTGFTEQWTDRLARVGIDRVTISTLTINYRTPAEVMAEAAPMILEALPDANVPTSIRESGRAVAYIDAHETQAYVDDWLAANSDGIACVIGDRDLPDGERVRSLSPSQAKGLEFDLVVLVDPDQFGRGISGAVDRYVAMTRTTSQLVIARNPTAESGRP